MAKTQRERMLGGELYIAQDPELRNLHKRSRELLWTINHTGPADRDARQAAFRTLLGGMGEDSYIEPPFYCDYGIQIQIGNDVYFNTGCVLLDTAEIRIGNNVMFAPGVHLYTASHPISPEVRDTFLEYALPITIEDSVWIGGLAVVNPGVTIGRGSIVGSGSIVTNDIPPMVIAAGNPCRVIRPITDDDLVYWQQKQADYIREMGPLPW